MSNNRENNNNIDIDPIGIVFACQMRSAHNVRYMLKRGCHPDETDRYGTPAIIVAARANSYGCVKVLKENGADINVEHFGDTVAKWAIYHQNRWMMRLAGVDPNNV